ncbi:BID domain-containing T4SS effector [Bartonella tribocorum]|uniref:protein adenylyltransferase n=1 Tax=Bartonella tribocorum TaxID=85701 RepID=A0A2M6URL8_9HYPH|nr:BID domain-containing T4SS effector [Bartonella tribocorum]PIT68829.1 adenosine monophosphate-protein transferase [Bartonella tribocorum]
MQENRTKDSFLWKVLNYKEISSPYHYTYPNSRTLKNKYGIKDLESFLEKCAHDTAKEMINLREAPLPEQFNSSYLCFIHRQLFKNTFEWAGQQRHFPFTFEDGTIAAMPDMGVLGGNTAFAIGNEIPKGLQLFDQVLSQKNNLQGLTREQFSLEAANLFSFLNKIHPFREGNGRTQRAFFEKLAQAAGHQLDFSLVTQRRMTFASVVGAVNGDLKPMQYLFEDISNPEKIDLLKEFMDNKENMGRNVNDRHAVMVAKEGETYTGIYRYAGPNSFAVHVNAGVIIGNKDQLTPEQHEQLKRGIPFTLTVPPKQELKNTLIPKGTLPPLENTEFVKRIKEEACVHTSLKQIQQLSKIVYGSSKKLDKHIARIPDDPASCQKIANQIANQIENKPNSIARLAGFSLCGLQSPARVNAKNHLDMLCDAVINLGHAVRQAQIEITQEHAIKQSHRAIKVAMPSKSLQDIFALPKELQQKALAKNPKLQKELTNLVKNINCRLSTDEHKAIKDNEYETLARSIGVSENKAREIAQTVKQAKEAHQQACTRTINRSNVLAMAN